MGIVNQKIAQSIKHPKNTWWGKFVVHGLFKGRNTFLEQNAVKLCKLEPHHHVLKVGIGPGVGLREALKYVKDGTGKIYAVESSKYMFEYASKSFPEHISSGKLSLIPGSVSDLQFNQNKFDRVFHCNSYYFWSRMHFSCAELYRVMKPGSFMVTMLDLDDVKYGKEKGWYTDCKTDPVFYMTCLEDVGFKNVCIEYSKDEKRGKPYQVIYAHKVEEGNNEIADIAKSSE